MDWGARRSMPGFWTTEDRGIRGDSACPRGGAILALCDEDPTGSTARRGSPHDSAMTESVVKAPMSGAVHALAVENGGDTARYAPGMKIGAAMFRGRSADGQPDREARLEAPRQPAAPGTEPVCLVYASDGSEGSLGQPTPDMRGANPLSSRCGERYLRTGAVL